MYTQIRNSLIDNVRMRTVRATFGELDHDTTKKEGETVKV